MDTYREKHAVLVICVCRLLDTNSQMSELYLLFNNSLVESLIYTFCSNKSHCASLEALKLWFS